MKKMEKSISVAFLPKLEAAVLRDGEIVVKI